MTPARTLTREAIEGWRQWLDRRGMLNAELTQILDAALHGLPAAGAEPTRETDEQKWRDAALQIGERLSDIGPLGYYDYDAATWLAWALNNLSPAPSGQQAETWKDCNDYSCVRAKKCMGFCDSTQPSQGRDGQRDSCPHGVPYRLDCEECSAPGASIAADFSTMTLERVVGLVKKHGCYMRADITTYGGRFRELGPFKARAFCSVCTQPKDEIADLVGGYQICRGCWNTVSSMAGELGFAVPPQGSAEHSVKSDERDTCLLEAWTATSYPGDYPPYFNFTMVRMRGDVVLTVRLPTAFGQPPGATSSVRFTREMWKEFVKALLSADRVFAAKDFLDSQL